MIHDAHLKGVAILKTKDFEKIRVLGTISAFDIKNRVNMTDLKYKFLDKGLLIRPLGNTIYFLPPYPTTPNDLEMTYQKTVDILAQSL